MSVRLHPFGCIPDKRDPRDRPYVSTRGAGTALPLSIDLRVLCPAVYDQSTMNACVAATVPFALVYAYSRGKAASKYLDPSIQFLYYTAREIEGTASKDNGVQIRSGLQAAQKFGVCQSTLCPLNPPEYAQKPPAAAFTDALGHRSISYFKVKQTLHDYQACLAEDFPVIVGMTVFSDIDNSALATGQQNLLMPSAGEHPIGNHCIALVGYTGGMFVGRNTWSAQWGVGGYFWLPNEYVASYVTSAWTVRVME